MSRAKRLTKVILQIPGVFGKAVLQYGGHPLSILRKLFLSIRERYEPEEALTEQLLDPSLPDSSFAKHVSRSTMARIQRQMNPLRWEALLADKSIFYRYCLAAGIPIPRLSAIFFRDTPGWTCFNRLLTSRDEWCSFLANDCPSDLVIKPSRGVYGHGIRFLHRTADNFLDAEGKQFTAGQIYDALASDARYDSFVVQERLCNHPDIVRLSGTSALQTMRMITVLKTDGSCAVQWAHMKIIAGNQFFDNYRHGEVNNLMVEIDTSTGVLLRQLLTRGKSAPVHPRTGLPVIGFQIPHWPEACAVVQRCAREFSPIGTVGWDVAITPEGPVMIEGNVTYDPPSPPDIAPFLMGFRSGRKNG